MATTTATIFIGCAHQNDSGIIPSHIILFNEGDRPSFVLQSLDDNSARKIVIPTLENTIDDLYLTIATLVLDQVKTHKEIHSSNGLSLYEIFDSKERTELYLKTFDCMQKNRIKLVVNILDGSHLLSVIDQIKKYPYDFEVTLPSMKKEYRAWSRTIEMKGI